MNTLKHLHPHLELCINAAIQAGEEILDVYKAPFLVEQKADNSPLTIADRRAHDVISKMLQSTSLPILSEEGKHTPYEERSKWDMFWLVDPLDGTKEFVKKNGEFTVNIALIQNNKPVMGIIYAPVMKKMYWAVKQHGAFSAEAITNSDYCFRNGVRLIHQAIPNVYRVVGSRSHMTKETADFIKEQRANEPYEMISIGSSLKFCLIAEGKAHLYPRLAPTMEWDTAAGHIIVEETGKKVIRYHDKQDLEYNKQDLLNPWFVVQ
jgi:3'(2'), 5'-bisphosphate nucleotidase